MRSIQSRLVNQTILMVNRTFSIQQILFDSIQSIQSRVNQTPVWSAVMKEKIQLFCILPRDLLGSWRSNPSLSERSNEIIDLELIFVHTKILLHVPIACYIQLRDNTYYWYLLLENHTYQKLYFLNTPAYLHNTRTT